MSENAKKDIVNRVGQWDWAINDLGKLLRNGFQPSARVLKLHVEALEEEIKKLQLEGKRTWEDLESKSGSSK